MSFIGVPVDELLCSSFSSLPPKDAIVAVVSNVFAMVVSFAILAFWKWDEVYRRVEESNDDFNNINLR